MAVHILFEYQGKLDCRTCDETLRKERGHNETGIVPFLVNGKQIFRCPLTLITPLSFEYIKAFNFYEKNILPMSGGWAEQGQKFIQAIMILENEFNKYRKLETEKNARRHSNKYTPKAH